jgi:hypothetical protein
MVMLLAILLSVMQGTTQPDVSALFEQGVTWKDFLEGVRSQQTTWQTNAARAERNADVVERFRRAAGDLKLLVVAEANCSDSVQTVPYLAAVADAAGIPMRIIGKAAAGDALDTHRTPDGRTATSTVILIRHGRDVGAWVERPAVLQTWFLAHPELATREKLTRKTGWYEWDRGATTLAEILTIVEATAGGQR